FLLVCKDVDILCEHKLAAELGERQLERYLALERSRPTFLALISNRSLSVPPEAASHPRYLHPQDGPAAHFLWCDLYPALAARPERLARDFAAYMRTLGMKPAELPPNWQGLFTDPEIAGAWGEQWRRVRESFVQSGTLCRIDPYRRGFQIKYPRPWLHLLY